MKRIALFLSLTISAAFAAPAVAQETASSEAFPIIRYERNPARAAVAGAGTATMIGGSAYAAFGSPCSAVDTVKKIEAAASYAKWAPGLSNSNNLVAGASFRLNRKLALSVGYAGQTLSSINVNGQDYTPKDMIIAGAVSFALGKSLSVGASVNYAKSELFEDTSISGTAFDLMLSYRRDAFGVAGGVRSLGGKIGNSSLPTSALVSGGYSIPAGPVVLNLVADADYYFSGNWSAAAGAEASVMSLVQVRAGYRFSSEHAVIPSHLSLGVGLTLGPAALDVTYLTASEYLDSTIMGGVRIRF
ncbi:MAG: hypothetical protein IKZ71_05270 [Bacteroidales bacterium]|nr:hypothetical protein [Bacteroidales bacterium]